MRFAAGLALIATLSGCEFAVRHPAITAGIAGGLIAGGTCELSTHNASGGSGHEGACAIVTGAAGVGLALIVAGAIALGGDGHTILWDEHAPPPPPPAPVKTFKTAAPPEPIPPSDVAPAAVVQPVSVDEKIAELTRQRDAVNAQMQHAMERMRDASNDADREAGRREMANLHGQQVQLNLKIHRLQHPEPQLPVPIEQRECPPDSKQACD